MEPTRLWTAAVVAAVAATFAQSAAAATPVTCRHAPGRTIAHNAEIKVTRFQQGPLATRSTRLFACALPNGRVRPITKTLRNDDPLGCHAEARSLRGRYLLLTFGCDDPQGGDSTSVVVDGVTGKHLYRYDNYYVGDDYSYFELRANKAPVTLDHDSRVLLSATGSLVVSYAAVDPSDAPETYIVAFDLHGRQTVLDHGLSTSVIARSLKLEGSTATWTSAGQDKQTTI
jgi:hypothetical protein